MAVAAGAALGDGERSAEADHREREAAGGADAGVAPVKAAGGRLDANDRRCGAYLRGAPAVVDGEVAGTIDLSWRL